MIGALLTAQQGFRPASQDGTHLMNDLALVHLPFALAFEGNVSGVSHNIAALTLGNAAGDAGLAIAAHVVLTRHLMHYQLAFSGGLNWLLDPRTVVLSRV